MDSSSGPCQSVCVENDDKCEVCDFRAVIMAVRLVRGWVPHGKGRVRLDSSSLVKRHRVATFGRKAKAGFQRTP